MCATWEDKLYGGMLLLITFKRHTTDLAKFKDPIYLIFNTKNLYTQITRALGLVRLSDQELFGRCP